MFNRFSLWACSLAFALGVSSAQATTVTYEFTTTVQSVDAGLSSDISAGQTVTGRFTVDTTAATTHAYARGGLESYAMTAFSIDFGAYEATSSTGTISVFNDADFGNPNALLFDRWSMVVRSWDTGAAVNGLAPGILSTVFEVRSAPPLPVLTSTDVEDAIDADIRFSYMNFRFGNDQNVVLNRPDFEQAQIRTRQLPQQPTVTPLPSSGFLIIASLLGLGFLRRRVTAA